MSETRTRRETPADKKVKPGPRVDAADPLQESLDELARMADSLVDGLAWEETAESPGATEESTLQPVGDALHPNDGPVELSEASQLASETPVALETTTPTDEQTEQQDEAARQSRRTSMMETLDALNHLIDDPSPPLVSAEVQVEGDRGEDIAACLDMVMTQGALPERQSAEPEDSEDDTTARDKPRKDDQPPVAPPDPFEETDVESAVAAGKETLVESETGSEVESSRRSTAIWWLVAIVVVIAAVAGSFYVLRSRSMASSTTTEAEVPIPDPPVVYTKRPELTVPVESTAPAGPASAQAESVGEPATGRPVAEPIARPTPVEQPPVPEPVADPAPVVESAAAEVPVATPAGGADVPTPAVMPTRGRSTESGDSQPQAAALAAIPLPKAETVESPTPTASLPAAEPAEAPERASVAASRPPLVVKRGEPDFDEVALRRGEKQTVVLRVLVDERGRVARVVVEESVTGSDAELAAINAVLRWSYEPALENGRPARSWTTQRFEFERPD